MRKRAMVRTRALALAGLPAFLLAWGCEDGTGPEEEVRLTISVSVPMGEPMVPEGERPSGASMSLDDGNHSLVLDRVALVLRELELKRLSDDDCDDLTGQAHEACEAFEVGPFLLELPLDGSILEIGVAQIPPDIYDEIEFDVHKPEDDGPEDIQFLLSHPEFKGVSIRVEGKYDGESFVFLQDLNEEREVSLSPPLVLEEGFGTVNLTLELDVASWFRTPDGSLVDPRSAEEGKSNEDLVESNIRASIRAFPDSDRDGLGD